MKRNMYFLFLLAFVKSFVFFAQTNDDFLDREKEIKTFLDSLRSATSDKEKLRLNDLVKKNIESSIQLFEAYNFPFSELNSIGFIKSPDEKIMIVNWNVELKSGANNYYCYIVKRDLRLKQVEIVELKQGDEFSNQKPDEIVTAENWYGCLYFQIIPMLKGNKTSYTLLGYDGLLTSSNMKLIDVMTLTSNSVKFGASSNFKVLDGSSRRLFFEFSEKATMAMRYDLERNRIVFDHLSPENPSMEGMYSYYVPDFSYDAVVLENNKWVLKEDVIATNKDADLTYSVTSDPVSGEIRKNPTEKEMKWEDPSSAGRGSSELHVAITEESSNKENSRKKDTKAPKSALEKYENKKGKKGKKSKSSIK